MSYVTAPVASPSGHGLQRTHLGDTRTLCPVPVPEEGQVWEEQGPVPLSQQLGDGAQRSGRCHGSHQNGSRGPGLTDRLDWIRAGGEWAPRGQQRDTGHRVGGLGPAGHWLVPRGRCLPSHQRSRVPACPSPDTTGRFPPRAPATWSADGRSPQAPARTWGSVGTASQVKPFDLRDGPTPSQCTAARAQASWGPVLLSTSGPWPTRPPPASPCSQAPGSPHALRGAGGVTAQVKGEAGEGIQVSQPGRLSSSQ